MGFTWSFQTAGTGEYFLAFSTIYANPQISDLINSQIIHYKLFTH